MSTQMDRLLAAQEKTQEKLRRAQEEEKQLKKRIAELKRNERTHRLCTRGGYVEKLLAELGAPELSDEEVFNHFAVRPEHALCENAPSKPDGSQAKGRCRG